MSSTADVTTPRPAANPTSTSADGTVRPQPMPAQQAAPPHVTATAPHAATQHPPQPAPVYIQQTAPPPQASAPPAAVAKPHPGKPKRGPVSRFIRSVFSHLLFAGVAVAGVLGYIYHAPILRDVGNTVCADNALGRWMDKTPGLAGAAPAAATVPAVAVTATPAPSAAAAPSPASAPVSPPASPPAAAAPAPAPAAPAIDTAKTKSDTTTTEPSPAASVAASKPADTPPATPTEPSPAPATTAALEPTPRSGAVATDQPQAAAVATPPVDSAEAIRLGLADAREAYAAGKPEAVAAYADLAKRFPDNPDLTGELGNILFQQGKKDEAGEQFFETGLRLIRAMQGARAACLVDVLRQLAPVRARELERMTTGATCPSSAVR